MVPRDTTVYRQKPLLYPPKIQQETITTRGKNEKKKSYSSC